jgi:hypothetical protein
VEKEAKSTVSVGNFQLRSQVMNRGKIRVTINQQVHLLAYRKYRTKMYCMKVKIIEPQQATTIKPPSWS